MTIYWVLGVIAVIVLTALVVYFATRQSAPTGGLFGSTGGAGSGSAIGGGIAGALAGLGASAAAIGAAVDQDAAIHSAESAGVT